MFLDGWTTTTSQRSLQTLPLPDHQGPLVGLQHGGPGRRATFRQRVAAQTQEHEFRQVRRTGHVACDGLGLSRRRSRQERPSWRADFETHDHAPSRTTCAVLRMPNMAPSARWMVACLSRFNAFRCSNDRIEGSKDLGLRTDRAPTRLHADPLHADLRCLAPCSLK